MNYFTEIPMFQETPVLQSQDLGIPNFYSNFKKRKHGQYYLYQPHRYVTSSRNEDIESNDTEMLDQQVVEGTQIAALYPEILAIIFSFLPVQEKGRACQVCKKWYNTIYQYKTLWKNVEAKIHLNNAHNYNNKTVIRNVIKSIIKRNITQVQILSINSNNNNNNLSLLFKSTPNNRYLSLRSLNLSGLYNINDSIISNLIFSIVRGPEHERAVLDERHNVHDISQILPNKFDSIKILNLSLCKLLSDNAILSICKYINKLEELNLSGCNGLCNYSMFYVYKYLRHLKALNLKSLWLVSDLGIGYLCGIGTSPNIRLNSNRSSRLLERLNVSIRGGGRIYALDDGRGETLPNDRVEGGLNQLQANGSNSNQNDANSSDNNMNENGATKIININKIVTTNLTKNLEILILEDCQRITDESIKYISTNMLELKTLNLSFCINITDNCLKYVNNMTKLQNFILKACNITDIGIGYIDSNNCNLLHLDLSFCESITDRSLQHISNYILQLKELYLNHCHITDVGLLKILKTLFYLENLYLGQCQFITNEIILKFIINNSNNNTIKKNTDLNNTTNSGDLINFNRDLSDLNLHDPNSSDSNRNDVNQSDLTRNVKNSLKYVDVYGCKQLDYIVILNTLNSNKNNIVINFGL